MPAKFGLQANRFEYKYLVSHSAALAIRDFIRAHLVSDEFSAPHDGTGYPVHSLYCDSMGLSLCRATMQGHKNRFKLRMRFYDDQPASPIFFEIKRRANDAIMKERVAVHRSSVPRLLAGYFPERKDMMSPAPRAWDTLQRFCQWYNDLSASGQVFVSYLREAFFSPDDNSVRVTFDRELRGSRYAGSLSLGNGLTWIPVAINGVIFEIKFTTRFPLWMGDMARIFNLQRRSIPKYIECVQALIPSAVPRFSVDRGSVA
jgi:hypothetical protein